MLFRLTKSLVVACVAMLSVFVSDRLSAQQNTLARQFDPVVFRVGHSELAGQWIDSLFAYKYNATTKEWTAIPFQIDEVDPANRYLRETEAVADSNDEVVLMPGDAGDQAPNDQWLSDPSAQKYTRFELEVMDPLVPSQKGWVYLYRRVSSPSSPPGYINHSPDPAGAGADTVKGLSYVEGHTSNGWINYLTLPKVAGVQPKNLIDRVKVRLKGIARFSIFTLPYDATEEPANFKFESIKFFKGPVRGLREWEFVIILKSGSLTVPIDTTSFVTQYFPYSSALGGSFIVKESQTALAGINLIRISLDLTPNAIGMQFYSVTDQVKSYPIDGNPDAPDSTLQDYTWLMATGSPGTLLTLIKVPNISGVARKLYYRDNDKVNGGTSDGTPDTGDMKSYSDMGIRFDGEVKGTLNLSFDLNFFYLDPAAQPRELGDKLNLYRKNPMLVNVIQQTRTQTRVADRETTPLDFALFDAHPNPFAPAANGVRIGFRTGVNSPAAQLRIFNLLGQEVARFDGADLLRNQAVLWDGRDRFGRLVPAGVYFYELELGQQRAVKKLIVLR